MARMKVSKTFSDDLRELILEIKRVIPENNLPRRFRRAAAWSEPMHENYAAAWKELWLYRAHCATISITIRDIEKQWGSLGSQKFIDEMQKKIDHYNEVVAVLAKWSKFMQDNGGAEAVTRAAKYRAIYPAYIHEYH